MHVDRDSKVVSMDWTVWVKENLNRHDWKTMLSVLSSLKDCYICV